MVVFIAKQACSTIKMKSPGTFLDFLNFISAAFGVTITFCYVFHNIYLTGRRILDTSVAFSRNYG